LPVRKTYQHSTGKLSIDSVLGFYTDNSNDIIAEHLKYVFNNTKWDLDGALHELNKQLALTKVGEAAAMTQMDKVLALEESLKRMRLSLMVEIKNILTFEK
jgi:hypothetical protein